MPTFHSAVGTPLSVHSPVPIRPLMPYPLLSVFAFIWHFYLRPSAINNPSIAGRATKQVWILIIPPLLFFGLG